MKLINCTPHALNIHHVDGILELAPSGILPRLAVSREFRDPIYGPDGEVITVVRSSLGAITDLPDQQDGVILITSALVADAAKRSDVMSPGELVRDGKGVIIGCLGLCTFV